MALTKVSYSMITGAVANVRDFGATGNGTTNDTVAIQAAIDSLAATGGTVFFPTGIYRIARNVGTNDRWGVKVVNSNISLVGAGNSTKLRRFDTDISTYGLAYPIVFIGTPDSNVAAATENVVVCDLQFIGENVQHSIGGSVIHDFRNAIEVKNTKNLVVQNNLFTNIDSAVIYYQKPIEFDYANNQNYNTTKNYNAKFINNNCIAVAHAIVSRNVLHAVVWSGVDFCEVSGNYFEWCDDCVAGEGTYAIPTQVETDTWTSSIGVVKRCGRGWQFNNNNVYNSSEHAVYAAGVDVDVCNNYFYTDAPAICAYQVVNSRSRNIQITGNVFANHALPIGIVIPSFDVNVVGNTIYAPETIASLSSSAVIAVDSDGLETYSSGRPWFTTNDTMRNIAIRGNTIQFPSTAASTGLYQIAFRIYTSGSSTLFPLFEQENISFCDNSVSGAKIGVFVINQLVRNIDISGNSFTGKSFTETGFSGSTVVNTYAALVINDQSSFVGQQIKFNNNAVRGSTYLYSTYTLAGTAVQTPAMATGNKLDYIQNFKSSDMNQPALLGFNGNKGLYFLDRTGWFVGGLNNSLSDGTNSNSALKSMITFDGTNVLFYKNDSGTTITLG
jgi:hypothetical protein